MQRESNIPTTQKLFKNNFLNPCIRTNSINTIIFIKKLIIITTVN